MYVCLERTTLAGFAKKSEYYNRFVLSKQVRPKLEINYF